MNRCLACNKRLLFSKVCNFACELKATMADAKARQDAMFKGISDRQQEMAKRIKDTDIEAKAKQFCADHAVPHPMVAAAPATERNT